MRISNEEFAGERYLQVAGERRPEDIFEKMMEKNKISGFLFPDILEMDGEVIYRYSISGKESLRSFHERKHMKPDEILQILEILSNLLATAEEYLISANRIIFDPEYIFVTKDRTLEICCGTEKSRNICRSLGALMQFLIKWMSHGSPLEMKKVYWIYDELQKENTSFLEIMNRQIEPPDLTVDKIMPTEEKKGRKWFHVFARGRKEQEKEVEYEDESCINSEITDETVALGTELLESREMIHRLKRKGQEMREDIPIYSYPSSVGKSHEMDIVISVPTVSGRHAQFQKSGEEIWIRDLGSLNGTYVNDIRICDAVLLESGDRIRFADQEYFFE